MGKVIAAMYSDVYKITDMLTSKSADELFEMKKACRTLAQDITHNKKDRMVYVCLAKLIKEVLLKNH